MDVKQVHLAWEAEERAVRSRFRPADAGPPTRSLRGLSGLETLQAIFAGDLPPPRMGETLDFLPIRMEGGLAVFQGRPSRRHYNPMGAVHTTLKAGWDYATLEIRVNLVRSLTDAVPLVRAEGTIIHTGRQVGTAKGRIVGPDGKLYAHATTTCKIFELPAIAR